MGEDQADNAWKAETRNAFHTRTILRHTRPVALAAIQKCGFQLGEDPPYSPDLAPSDYYLFPKMKKEFGGHYFARYDVMNAVDQNGAIYTEGIRLLHDRWTNCVNVGGDYVEKLMHLIF